MSTHSYPEPCPNCDEEMSAAIDNRPYTTVFGYCLHCGFEYYTHEAYLELDDLNRIRADEDLPPLDSLPERRYAA